MFSVRVHVPTLDEVRSSSVRRLAAMVPVMPQVAVYTWIHEGNAEEENNGYVVSTWGLYGLQMGILLLFLNFNFYLNLVPPLS
jgi:hypothetical protein